MKKALIYGFGWSGYTLLQFLEDCNVEVICIDDKVDFSEIGKIDKRYMDKHTALKLEFDIYLITIFDKDKAKNIRNNLVELGVDANKVKHAYNESYTSSMSYLIKRFFKGDIIEYLLLDDYEMHLFHRKIQDLTDAHHANKRNRENNQKTLNNIRKFEASLIDRNIFAKIKALSNKNYQNDYMYYPGFSVCTSSFVEDKDFHFIEKVDWEFLQKRPKEIKLIAVFGNSAMRVEYLPRSNTITSFMRKNLKENYVVVNFGVVGASIYEQLLLYNSLVYPLKPEIVVSCFGGVEYVYAPISDESLLKTHKITYTPWNWEMAFRDKTESAMPLYCDIFGEASKNTKMGGFEANIAINSRVRQFANNVSGGGGIFYAFIQPLLPCKLNMSEVEEKMRNKEKERFDQTYAYQNKIIEQVPTFINDLKNRIKDCDFVFDLNPIIAKTKDTLFESNWVHLNARGNEMVAQEILRVLKV